MREMGGSERVCAESMPYHLKSTFPCPKRSRALSVSHPALGSRARRSLCNDCCREHQNSAVLLHCAGGVFHGSDDRRINSEYASLANGPLTDNPCWVKARFKELAEIDPNSTAFRYAENYDKHRKQYVPVGGEIYVGLNHLHDAIKTLNSVLLRVWEADEDRERNLD